MKLLNLFNKKKRTNKIQHSNTSLDIYTNSIPNDIRELLFISNTRTVLDKHSTSYSNFSIEFSNGSEYEPSEIITNLPIKTGNPEKLGYYPSYHDMSPQQRFKYLTFLKNIDEPIDIGYVFVFYYGLERKIYIDENLYEAVNMIKRLQKNHSNRSFIAYSNDALIYAAMKKKDPNILLDINLDNLSPELLFLVKGSFIGEFTPDDLISLAKGVNFSNDRYIKSQYKLFKENVSKVLHQKFNSKTYKLNKSEKIDTNQKIRLTLANISIENREFEYPNTLLDSKIQSDIYFILKESHDITKKDVALMRKNNKNKENTKKITEKKEAQSIFIPSDSLTLKERILLSKDPKSDGFDEEIRGFELYKEGNYKEAEDWLLRSVKGKFNAPALYERLGILYRKQRRYNDEVEILKIGITNVGFNPKLNARLAKAIEINEKEKLKTKR